MICPLKKFVFIHIPKTGGTSIEDALFTFPEVYHFLKDKNRNKPLINNAFFPLREAGLAETIKNNPNYFLFAFVRNPWDRFVSLYRHSSRVRLEARTNKRVKKKQRADLSFDEYVEIVISGIQDCCPLALKYFNDFDFFHTKFKQVQYLLEYSKTYLNSEWDLSFRKIDFIGRFETLEEDYRKLEKPLGLKLPPLGRRDWGSVTTPPYRNFYTPTTQELIAAFYKEDIEHFHYNY